MSKENELLGGLLDRNAKIDRSDLVDDVAEVTATDLPEDRLISPDAGKPHFTDSQEKDAKHRHVAKAWTDRCIDWDTFQDMLEENARHNSDVLVSADRLKLVEGVETLLVSDDSGEPVEKERRVLRLKVDGEGEFDFSGHSLGQMSGPQFCGLGGRRV